MLFTVPDYQGIPVNLSKTTWYDKLLNPIFGHPEVKPFRSAIKSAISNPEYVYQSIRDPRSKLFYTRITQRKFASYFLSVVVKYVRENDSIAGYVSTAMINRKLPKGSKLIWEKKVLT